MNIQKRNKLNLDLKKLENKIKTARVLLNLSQKRLAKTAAIRQSTIFRIELNPNLVLFGNVIKTIKALIIETNKQPKNPNIKQIIKIIKSIQFKTF